MKYLRIGMISLMLAVSFGFHSAWGQTRLGVRGGITLDPDQVHFGAHGRTIIAPHVRFQPNVELGIGNNLRIVGLNPEIAYVFKSQGNISPYAGGGPGIHIIDVTGVFGGANTEIGINLIGGFDVSISAGRAIMVELKIGVGDIPDVKVTGGVTF